MSDFKQWLLLFGGELLMNLVIYADDSGTHDLDGVLPQSQVTTIGGYVGKSDSWLKLSREWKKALRDHSAPYFHFTELQYAENCRGAIPPHKRNPYTGWTPEQCQAFRLACAKIAASGNRIPVCGDWNTKAVAEDLPKEYKSNSRASVVWLFYDAARDTIKVKWPKLQGPITVCFDHTQNPDWRNAIFDVHGWFKNKYGRFGIIGFGDKNIDINCHGLQAADLIAGRLRQLTRIIQDYDPMPGDSLSELDSILFSKFGPKNLQELLARRSGFQQLPNLPPISK